VRHENPLSAPDIDAADIEAVVSVLHTSRISLGPKLEEFEEAVASFIGVPYGVALSSARPACTSVWRPWESVKATR